MTKDEALKLALEALQKIYIAPEHEEYIRVWWPACEQAITAIKEALAQPEQICGLDVVLDESMPPNTFKLAQPEQEHVATSDTSEKRVDETAKQRHEQDKTEQGRNRSAILGNNVEATMEAGLSFTQALNATLKVYDHPAQQDPVIDKSAAVRIATSLGWEPKRKPLTERELMKCIAQAACFGTVKMSFESGPYDIDRPTLNADKLCRAIEAAHGIKE